MIRAASELIGTVILLGGGAALVIYGFFYWRMAVRRLKRDDIADEKATGIHV